MIDEDRTNRLLDNHDIEPVDAAPEKPQATDDTEELSPEQVKRNMLYCIMLDTIWLTGWADFTVALTPLLVYLNASNTTIGFVNGATWVGLFGMFLSPWISQRFKIKKWYLILVNVPYIGALGVAGLGIAMSHKLGISDPSLLKFTVYMIMAHMFFAGFVALPHQEYVAACIPMSHRGRLSGLSVTLGSALSIGSSAIAGIILLKCAKPMAFGYLFLMTWAICQGGYIFAFFAKEKPTPVEKSPSPWSKGMLKAVWADKPYFRFLTMASLYGIVLGSTGGFTMVYGFKELGIPLAASALLNIIAQVVRVGTSAPIGFLIDKLGAKKAVRMSMLQGPIVFAVLLLWHHPGAIYFIAILSGILGTIYGTANGVLMYGLPKPENRSGHYTVQLMSQYATGALAPILGGYLCDAIGYRSTFSIGLVSTLLFVPFAMYMTSILSDDTKKYS